MGFSSDTWEAIIGNIKSTCHHVVETVMLSNTIFGHDPSKVSGGWKPEGAFACEDEDDGEVECGTVGGSASLSCLLCSLLRLSLDDVGLGHKTEAAPPVQPCKPSPSHPPQHHHHHPGWPTPFHPHLRQTNSSQVCSSSRLPVRESECGWRVAWSFCKTQPGVWRPSTPSLTCLIINIIILIIIMPQLWILVPTSMWNADVNAGSIQAIVLVVGMWRWVDHERFVRFWAGL